jgi:hypothetical protein
VASIKQRSEVDKAERVSEGVQDDYARIRLDGGVIDRYIIGGDNKIQIVTQRNTSAFTIVESR